MPGQRRKLTVKQHAFTEEYLRNGRNGAAAYRTVYSPQASVKSAAEEASKLLRHPNIAPMIAEADQARTEGVRETLIRYKIDQQGVTTRLALMADTDIFDVLKVVDGRVVLRDQSEITPEAAYAIAELRQTENGLIVKMTDKRAALMDLAKLSGWIIDRSQGIGADGKPVDPRATFVLKVER